MPQDTAPTAAATAPEAPAFPADTRTLALSAPEFAAGNVCISRFRLNNPHHAVLHVRLATSTSWLSVLPTEAALGPGEQQIVAVRTDTTQARAAVRGGAAPHAPVQIAYQHLYPATRGVASPTPQMDSIYVQLPVATCPSCKRSLDDAIAEGTTNPVPDFCPYCFERLRSCPICGAPNSWLVRRCVLDESHIVRSSPDWGMLGGDPGHAGSVETKVDLALGRRWSYPSVPPSRRENALAWSAPVAAYGMVAAAAATADGEAHLYAFDALNGATLWDPYPLVDPVYPDRGGAALAAGHLFAATVEGICVCIDAQRGTRIWETSLPGRVYGAVVPTLDGQTLLVNVSHGTDGGILVVLDAATGSIRQKVTLAGPPDSAPAYAGGMAFVHDDRGTLTAIEIANGTIRWSVDCEAGFDAAPVVRDGQVYSAAANGVVWCHEVETGNLLWKVSVTNAPFGGTPAHDGSLLYLPADDGVHLLSGAAGRAVRRYPARPVRSAPVLAAGTLFFGATDGNVYGTAAGRPLEKLYETGTVGSQIVAAPAFADGSLFVTATNGVLYALSPLRQRQGTPTAGSTGEVVNGGGR